MIMVRTRDILVLWQQTRVMQKDYEKHFRCTIAGPDSSYSSLLIHILWNVESDARIDPPIHTEYFLSGGATIFTLIEGGAKAVISLPIRSLIPGNIVVPPESTMLA